MKNLEESWISIINPPQNAQTEESCLFMLNFNKSADTMVTSSSRFCQFLCLTVIVNVIDIWDFRTKEKLKSLTDHTEIVTGVVRNFYSLVNFQGMAE